MIASIQQIDILDLEVDALIYSTNVRLNCTGGIGACLMERYGKQVQTDLHTLLSEQGTTFASQGSVFEHVTEGMPYQRVYHTIPCDGLYNTTEEIVSNVLVKSLEGCLDCPNVSTVALSALATGYGHLLFEDFFRLASSILSDNRFAPLASVTIGVPDQDSYQLAAEQVRIESLKFNLL